MTARLDPKLVRTPALDVIHDAVTTALSTPDARLPRTSPRRAGVVSGPRPAAAGDGHGAAANLDGGVPWMDLTQQRANVGWRDSWVPTPARDQLAPIAQTVCGWRHHLLGTAAEAQLVGRDALAECHPEHQTRSGQLSGIRVATTQVRRLGMRVDHEVALAWACQRREVRLDRVAVGVRACLGHPQRAAARPTSKRVRGGGVKLASNLQRATALPADVVAHLPSIAGNVDRVSRVARLRFGVLPIGA
jgi:hypothetical protein